jgi:hypothetical protein
VSQRIFYAYLDEAPVVFSDDEAWEYFDGVWKPLNLADAMCKARLLTKEEFDRYAGPGLPPPPFALPRHPSHPGIVDAPAEAYGRAGGFYTFRRN